MPLHNNAWDEELFGRQDSGEEELLKTWRQRREAEERDSRPAYEDPPPANELAAQYLCRLRKALEADAIGHVTENIHHLMSTIGHLFSDLLEAQPDTLTPEERSLVDEYDKYDRGYQRGAR